MSHVTLRIQYLLLTPAGDLYATVCRSFSVRWETYCHTNASKNSDSSDSGILSDGTTTVESSQKSCIDTPIAKIHILGKTL